MNRARARRATARRRWLGALVLLGVLASAALAASPHLAAASPRVAIVVGPAGSVTAEYRSLAGDAARAARAAGATVVEAYSPNATWPTVRAALEGASIVVYLGHGNGWPSKYSNTLNPETQDGLGLNPIAGVDDIAHRYFGESYLSREVRLAPNAIVVLSRLCYASGNSEPGLPEGTLADATARAGNFAAGFLAAGAGAVVADAFAPPAYYVRSLLGGGGRSVEAIWRAAPTFHNHVLRVASARTPGATGLLDPTQASSGFYRSLVGRTGIGAATVVGSAIGGTTATVPAARPGPAISSLALGGRPIAGGSVTLGLGLAAGKDVVIPSALGIGVRWIPLTLDPASPHRPGPAADPSPSLGPVVSPSRGPVVSPSPSPGLAWSLDDPAGLVAEEPAGMVTFVAAAPAANGFSAPVAVPAEPGLYRLVVTLQDGSGAAYDAATQAAIPALLVRVGAPLAAAITAPAELSATGGDPISLDLAIVNPGSAAWTSDPGWAGPRYGEAPARVTLVGRWLALDPAAAASASFTAAIGAPLPGAVTSAVLSGRVPNRPGAYLLTLDIVSPTLGSLTWAGALEPPVIRVTVLPVASRAH